MSNQLQNLSYFDLKGLKKAAAFRGNVKLEQDIQNEMTRRVAEGKVTEGEMEAAAYL